MHETREYIVKHQDAPYEVAGDRPEDNAGMNFRVRRRRTERSDEILARTLPHVLSAKTSKPLLAWIHFFVSTEP